MANTTADLLGTILLFNPKRFNFSRNRTAGESDDWFIVMEQH